MAKGKAVSFLGKVYADAVDFPAPLAASADVYAAITPNDSTDLPGGATRAIWAGTAGAAAVIDRYGHSITIQLIAGWNPFTVARVKAAGTAATGLLAIY
jgi:hypothetical protein